MKLMIALYVLFILPSVAMSAEWELVNEAEGVKVYTRSTPSGFKEARATLTISAPLKAVVAAYADPNSYSGWMSNCVESRRVGTSGSYIRIDIPIPFISDRDVVVESVRVTDSPTEVIFEGEMNPSAMPAVEGVVRMAEMQNRWAFRAISATSTEVEMFQRMEPGGRMPMFGFNQSVKKSPVATLKGLASFVASGDGDRS